MPSGILTLGKDFTDLAGPGVGESGHVCKGLPKESALSDEAYQAWSEIGEFRRKVLGDKKHGDCPSCGTERVPWTDEAIADIHGEPYAVRTCTVCGHADFVNLRFVQAQRGLEGFAE